MHASLNELEKRIIVRLVNDLINAGKVLNVDNGGDSMELPAFSSCADTVLNAMAETDVEHLIVSTRACPGIRSSILLVYGNGIDLISDYGMSLHPIIEPIFAWIESMPEA